MSKTKMHALAELKQSIWLDYVHRSLLVSDGLQDYIDKGLRGITSNPAIFSKAITESQAYDDDLRRLALAGKPAQEIYEALVIKDIQDAADMLHTVFEQTNGEDGFVSLEVNPHLARKTQETIDEVHRLTNAVDRPNVMIKVPATPEGILAIQQLTSDGYNINVTLIFSLAQYDLVAESFLSGLEKRSANSFALKPVASVASLFVSRLDTKIDEMLDILDTPESHRLRGKIGIDNAKIVYQHFRQVYRSKRWRKLAHQGARVQRLLFGSTSTKDPNYSDTLYPDNLIGPMTINTLPPDTLKAFWDHGTVAPTLEKNLKEARDHLQQLESLGINLDSATNDLLEEGLDKFVKPYDELIDNIAQKMAAFIVA